MGLDETQLVMSWQLLKLDKQIHGKGQCTIQYSCV